MRFSQVGVIGGGAMGSGIAEVCAKAGRSVVIVDIGSDALAAARDRVATSTLRAVNRGKLTADEREAAIERIEFASSLSALAGSDLVIEAVAEDEQVKAEVFGRLGEIVSDDAVVATNTSAMSVTRLAGNLSLPERFLGLHFFNPAPVRRLVEVVDGQLTDPMVGDQVELFVTESLGKVAVRTSDRPGFVVNALLTPYLLSAIRLLEQGAATAEQIDLGMVEGCAHPIGPLHLADMVGLDTLVAASEAMYGALREPQYCPPPLLVRMVEAGLTGTKSGRGFFTYDVA